MAWKVLFLTMYLLYLASSTSGITCLCDSNFKQAAASCGASTTCTMDNAICSTTYNTVNGYEVMLSKCLDKDRNTNWQSLCSRPITRCCDTDLCNEAFHNNKSIFEMPTSSSPDVKSTGTSLNLTQPTEPARSHERTGDTELQPKHTGRPGSSTNLKGDEEEPQELLQTDPPRSKHGSGNGLYEGSREFRCCLHFYLISMSNNLMKQI